MAAHARLSPSSAHRWSSCTASPSEEDGRGDNGNDNARWGTACHLLSETCLLSGKDAREFAGLMVGFPPNRGDEVIFDPLQSGETNFEFMQRIDEDLVNCAQTYIKFVRDLVATSGGTLFVENRLSIEHITGEEGAKGTSDAIIVTANEIITVDLKGGMGKVMAFDDSDPFNPTPNPQLAMYTHAAYVEHGWQGDITHTRMIIVQPRLHHVSEFSMAVPELEAFIAGLSAKAIETRTNPVHVPSSDNCHFCKAKGDCKALRDNVLETTLAAFDDISDALPRTVADIELGALYAKLSMIEGWIEGIRARVMSELSSGRPVAGYKLVAGKRGARQWVDEDQAEATLKAMRLTVNEMYNLKLISPTQAEKLSKAKGDEKAVIGPRSWPKVETMITQPEGKPAIAKSNDPRPALVSAADSFDNIDSVSDLF